MRNVFIKYGAISVFLVGGAWFLFSGAGKGPVEIPEPEERPAFFRVLSDSTERDKIVEQAESIRTLNSLIVQQRGERILEEYFHGMNATRERNLKSASKSVMSLLAGIAVREGYIDSVGQPIHHFFLGYFDGSRDSLKRTITVKDVLTMRTGLETTSFHNYGRWVTSDNWVRFALDQPMEELPGGDMMYSTGTSHLLSAIIAKTSGMSTRAFAMKFLFGPLGIEPGGWDRDPQGIHMGGNNLSLRPADMMKIGQMVMNGGTWQGRQLVPKDWLEDSFKTYTRSNYNPYDYGYMWWKKKVGGYQAVFAWGYGGQYIFLFPQLETVIVITSYHENATQDRSYKEPVFELVEEIVTPRKASP